MPNRLKVQELRSELTKRGLSTTGIKPTLVQRLECDIRKEMEKIPDNSGSVGKKRTRYLEDGGNLVGSNGSDKIKAVDEFRKMGIKQLREQASLRGISTTGSKKELLERLSRNSEKRRKLLQLVPFRKGFFPTTRSGNVVAESVGSSTGQNSSNPKKARYVNKDGCPSFKTLDSIFARSKASGLLAFGTTSSHAPIAKHFSKDDNHTDALVQKEHHIDNVVNDFRSRLNRLCSTSSIDICGNGLSSQSVSKGKRKVKETNDGENWLKIMVQAIVDSKTKPNAQFVKCIHILTEMGYTGREKLRLQMVLKDDIGLQTIFLENDNDDDRRLLIKEYMSK